MIATKKIFILLGVILLTLIACNGVTPTPTSEAHQMPTLQPTQMQRTLVMPADDVPFEEVCPQPLLSMIAYDAEHLNPDSAIFSGLMDVKIKNADGDEERYYVMLYHGSKYLALGDEEANDYFSSHAYITFYGKSLDADRALVNYIQDNKIDGMVFNSIEAAREFALSVWKQVYPDAVIRPEVLIFRPSELPGVIPSNEVETFDDIQLITDSAQVWTYCEQHR